MAWLAQRYGPGPANLGGEYLQKSRTVFFKDCAASGQEFHGVLPSPRIRQFALNGQDHREYLGFGIVTWSNSEDLPAVDLALVQS